MLKATLSFEQASEHLWDVIVVGAGPAGAFAAREAARQNGSVLLVDKSAFPRYKVCGGCLSASALAILDAAGLGDLMALLHAQPIHELRLAVDAQTASIPLPAGAAVSREALDAALIERAVYSGAHFLPLTTAVLGEKLSGSRGISLCQGTNQVDIQARAVLVADGLGGGLLKNEAGFEKVSMPESRVGVGTLIQAPSGFYESGAIFMACAPGGYVGIVRVEGERLDIAAAFDPEFLRRAGGAGHAVESVVKQAGFPAIEGLVKADWRGTPALTNTRASLASERLFVLGDAAGYVEPFTGEGIAWALASALAVVPFALQAASHWEPSLAQGWTQCHHALLSGRQKACKRITRLLRRPLLMHAAVSALTHVPGLARPLVDYVNSPLLISNKAGESAYAGASWA